MQIEARNHGCTINLTVSKSTIILVFTIGRKTFKHEFQEFNRREIIDVILSQTESLMYRFPSAKVLQVANTFINVFAMCKYEQVQAKQEISA